jgi:cell division protein FtsI/penicillin-binding protein 2
MTTSDWGEYVIWKLPESKVSVDGRYWTVYPPDSIIQNMVFQAGWEGWEHYLDLYPHEIILTVMGNKAIESHKGWVKIYQDHHARIFVRKTDPPHTAHKNFIDRTLVYNSTPPSPLFP